MIGVNIDWNVFNFKFSSNPRTAFENLAYSLFCFEFKQRFGIFRYFNQPYIETLPIETSEGDFICFQAKYYDESTKISDKKDELKKAITDAKIKYPRINRFIIYTNKELSASSKKNQVKPEYQINIEECGSNIGIQVEWRVKSHFEIMLLNPELKTVKDLYFDPDLGLQKFADKIQKRTSSILENIKSNITFNGHTIKIEHSQDSVLKFAESNNKALIVYGQAGTGKSGYIKDAVETIKRIENSIVLVFSSTDFDVADELSLLTQFGDYQIEDLFSLYTSHEEKYCIIESVEKYTSFKNFEFLQKAIRKFIDNGWRLIFSIREQYLEGFCNIMLDNIASDRFCVNSINATVLAELSEKYSFKLPSNTNVCNLIYNLFYLKLYLQLSSSDTDIPSDTKSFTDHLWKYIFRSETTRRNNLPVRREQFLENMALSMLNNEVYIYEAQSSDDSEAIVLLEEQGIIAPYNDTAGLWVFSHDVYEEITVNHVFDKKYYATQDFDQIAVAFNNSLRSRKMYRIWLESKLREPDSNLLLTLTNALESTNLQQSWKDETLIALMNSENNQAFQIMESLFSNNGFSLFSRSVFLLNTACKCITKNKSLIKLSQIKKINSYRFTEPSGKAWHTIFGYIHKNRALIPWNTQNLNIVIEAMESWVSNNSEGKTTSLVGQTALFLKEKIWNESGHKYGLYADAIYVNLNKIILLAAMEIKNELAAMVDNIVQNNAYSHRNRDYIFLTKSLSSIYSCGKVTLAIPEKILQLAWGYWLHKDENDYFSFPHMESYFGFNNHLNSEYYPSSAYQTPIYALLQIIPRQCIDFILKLTNYAAQKYKESTLNERYNECCEIQIILNSGEHISQICSDRLWKVHRGTGVAPHLLESTLMAFEDFLLQYVDDVSKDEATALCLYLLRNSNNVSITSVVLSIVLAHPDKLFDISCILLKTKEIFEFDASRFSSESSSNFLKGLIGTNQAFDKERIASNNKAFRKNTFRDVILNYQINAGHLSETDFKERQTKLYLSIDEVTAEIDNWHPIHQACYYNIDLRKYKQAGESIIEDGHISVPLEPDMPQQVIEYSKKSTDAVTQALGDIELKLWASFRYRGDQKYKQYQKYENNPISAYHAIKDFLESDAEELPLISPDTIVFTLAVLLRDYNEKLSEEQIAFCKEVFIEFGVELIKKNSSILYNDDVKNAVITALSNLADSSDLSFHWNNPIFILLAFMLDFRNQYGESMVNPLSILWESSKDLAYKLILTFIKFIPLFDGNDVVAFVETHEKDFYELLTSDTDPLDAIDVDNLEYNALIYINTLLDCHDASILELVIKLGKQFWYNMFHHDRDGRTHKIYELESNYKLWLSEYLLNISYDAQNSLIQEMMPLVGFDSNFNSLLSNIVSAEDINSRYDAFWNLWKSMQEYIFPVYEGIAENYKKTDKGVHIGYGFEDVLVTYLLANPFWKDGISEWHSLKQQNNSFYLIAAKRLGYNPTVLFSIARVLYTVGKNPFTEDGVVWLSEIIRANPHLFEKPLPENTLFYIEEYIFSYVKKHITSFKTDQTLKRKVLIVLDYLVAKGSTMGFLLREEIV